MHHPSPINTQNPTSLLFPSPTLPPSFLTIVNMTNSTSSSSNTTIRRMLVVLFSKIFFPSFFTYLFSKFSAALSFLSGYRKRPPIPPGTMGWPYIGETFQLYSNNPLNFLAQKQKRYGSVFKTHVLGCPCIMVSSPAAAKFVLLTKADLFKPTFPASKERMLGRRAIFFQHGEHHSKLRKVMLRAFKPDAIRIKVSSIEEIAVATLRSWDGQNINAYQEMKTYAFDVVLLSIFQKEELTCKEELKECYFILEKGYNSMPINLPGTLFHKAMKARQRLSQIFANILCSRREMKIKASDLLGSLMEDESLTDDQIADNIIGIMFAARDTTASALTWAVKYLKENSAFLQAVIEEQEDIINEKKDGEKSITWEDIKKMEFTSKVIQETLRMASILSFTFREAVEDVEYEGYLIPKGWKVMPLFRNIHHSPDNFADPEKFQPSRFEVPPKPNTFMPFGNGIHSCPGNELAKLEMLVLLHHLTTKYRWSLLGSSDGIQFSPFVLPMNGLPIAVSAKS